MDDDLISTAEAANLLGCSVATLNRWATDSRSDRLRPALKLPGHTGARLYRKADVLAYRASQQERVA